MTFPYMVKVRAENKTGLVVDVQPEPIASKPQYIVVVALSIKTLLERYANRTNSIGARISLQEELTTLLTDLHHQGIIVPKRAEKEKDERTLYLDHLRYRRTTKSKHLY